MYCTTPVFYCFTDELLILQENTSDFYTLNVPVYLASGLYRVVSAGMEVSPDYKYSVYGDRSSVVKYPGFMLKFLITETAGPEPVDLPTGWPAENSDLPEAGDWLWYQAGHVRLAYENAGMAIKGGVFGKNGFVAVCCSGKNEYGAEGLYKLEIFDRKTGERYAVFSEPAVEIGDVAPYEDGFIIKTDGSYYCFINGDGDVELIPLPGVEYTFEDFINEILNHDIKIR